MKPIHHKYSWFIAIAMSLYNILGLLSPFFVIFLLLINAITDYLPITIGDMIGLILYGVFLGLVLILTGNFYPDIISDKDGLHIKFLRKNIVIPWEDIIDLRPMFNISFLKRGWVIIMCP